MLKSAPAGTALHLYTAFSVILLGSILGAIALQQPLLAMAPAALLFAGLVIADYRKVYLFLFLLLPVSFDFDITRSLAINLPAEPVMMILFVLLVVLWIKDRHLVDPRFVRHPVIILLLIHLLWIGIMQLYTVNYVVTLKFFLAKLWFVGVGTFMTAVLAGNREGFQQLAWATFISLVPATVFILLRHAATGFSFEEVNATVMPIFRNHVNYAALLTIVLPWFWFMRKWYPSGSVWRNWLTFGIIILLAGTFFSYTRAAWIALFGALGAYYLIRQGLLKYTFLTALIGSLVLIYYLAKDNKYLDFAPNYETTIYHTELGDHLEATVNFQDVSSAERVYRWVAAFHMFTEKPLTGNGPGNFYPYYKEHTVLSFMTYVSDNEERSTVHNYYLLILVEQGLIGFIIFLLLVLAVLWYGENLYHQVQDTALKQYVMALLLSIIIILIHLLVSDLMEVNKIGTLFFVATGLLVALGIQQRSLKPTA